MGLRTINLTITRRERGKPSRVSGQTKSTSMPVESTEKTLEGDVKIKKIQYGKHQQDCVYDTSGIAPTIAPGTHGSGPHLLKVIAKGANSMKETSQQLIPTTSQTMTSWLEVFLVRHSALQVNVGDSMTPEELSFLKSQGFSETKDPDVFYSKTSKAYYLTTLEKLSKPYLKFSPTLGIELNGRYLILKTSEFRRTGNECSLSDILEEKVEDKYFLSDAQVEKIANWKSQQNPLRQLLQREEQENTIQE